MVREGDEPQGGAGSHSSHLECARYVSWRARVYGVVSSCPCRAAGRVLGVVESAESEEPSERPMVSFGKLAVAVGAL